MNRPSYRSLWVCAASAVLLVAVAETASAEDFPKGKIVASNNDQEWSIDFADKGKFTVTHDGDVVIEGMYKITKDELEMSDESGPLAGEGDKKTGTFKWKRDGKKLMFTLVKDENEGRSMALTTWEWTVKD